MENLEIVRRVGDLEGCPRVRQMRVGDFMSRMRAELTDRMREETAFDPYMEATLYLDAVGNSHGGEGTPQATQALTGTETIAEILQTAISLEQKSIAFYVGLRDMVPPKLGQGKVDAIIAEEKQHVATLVAELKKARGEGDQ